ncbi:MAG: hypothetical protein AAGD32_17460 [Planctomycetota bacterium]
MLVFAHIEKTAGKTMRSLLRRRYGSTQCDLYNSPHALRDGDLAYIKRFYPVLRCVAGHACMPGTFIGDLPHARHFTFLRDPVQRAASAYQYGHHRGRAMPPFEAWAAATANFQTRALTRQPLGTAHADDAIRLLDEHFGFVGLVERFDESLILFKHWLGDPGFRLTYRGVNVAPDNQMKKQILADESKRQLLIDLNPHDLALYAHVRDRLYPQQQAAFGPPLPDALSEFKQALQTTRPLAVSLPLWTNRLKRNLVFRPLWKRRLRGRPTAAPQ